MDQQGHFGMAKSQMVFYNTIEYSVLTLNKIAQVNT